MMKDIEKIQLMQLFDGPSVRIPCSFARTFLELAYYVGEFYGDGADSIGHGKSDHISSVIMRATLLGDIINTSPENTEKMQLIDITVTKLCALYHDIGNLVSRSGHNHFSYGIMHGQLNATDILSVPNKDISGNMITRATSQRLSEIMHHVIDFPAQYPYLSQEEKAAYLQVLLLKTTFDIAYQGLDVPDLKQYWQQNYGLCEGDSEYNLLLSKLTKANQTEYKDEALRKAQSKPEGLIDLADKLRAITHVTQSVFIPQFEYEFDIVANSAQDHNIDWKMPEHYQHDKEFTSDLNNRYRGRSVYSMIVADADKSNDPVSEAIRSLKFSLEKMVPEGNDTLIQHVDDTGKIYPAIFKQDGKKYIKNNDPFAFFIRKKSIFEVKEFDTGTGSVLYFEQNGKKHFLYPAKDEVGHYIPDMDAVAKNVQEQFEIRFQTDTGKDSFMQLDTIEGFDISNRIFGKIHEVSDDNKKLNMTIQNAIESLSRFNSDAGQAVSYSENQYYGYTENENTDNYKWALEWYPEATLQDWEKMYHRTDNLYVLRRTNNPCEDVLEHQILSDCTNFQYAPSRDEMIFRAKLIAQTLNHMGVSEVEISGAPYFSSILSTVLQEHKITPLFALHDTLVKVHSNSKEIESIVQESSNMIPYYQITQNPVLLEKARILADLASQSHCKYAMITGGNGYLRCFNVLLEKELLKRNIIPVYNYKNTKIHPKHLYTPAGCQEKTSFNEHDGFVSPYCDCSSLGIGNTKIFNLTPFAATREQKEDNLVDGTKSVQKEIKKLYHFTPNMIQKIVHHLSVRQNYCL